QMTSETPEPAPAASRAPGGDREPVLELRGLTIRSGAVQALTDIPLTVGRGEVVGLVGDNGAGKSTLSKVIAGVHAADEGDLVINGMRQRFASPKDAQKAGVATVFQDLALCENLDVVANLFLGHEKTRGPVLDEVVMEAKSWELLRSLSAKIPSVRVPIAALSGGQRQSVANVRSLLGEPSLVMLDEPTAALGVAQTAELLNLIERLKAGDLGVLLVSHNMADVQAVGDRVHVLRLGKDAGDFPGDERTDVLVAAITGASDKVVTQRAARRGERR